MARKNLESISGTSPEVGNQALAKEGIDAVLARADGRRLDYDFRAKLVDFSALTEVASEEKTMQQKLLSEIMAEAAGEATLTADEAEKFLQNKKIITARADGMINAAPGYAQLSYGLIAKAEQASGEDFSGSLRLAQEIRAGVKNEPVQKISDFMPDAVLLGILHRQIRGRELPDIKILAEAAVGDDELLRACALALSESAREEFLNYLPDKMRNRAGQIWDESLSRVMKERYLEESDKESLNRLRSRAQEELKKSLAAEGESGGVETIRILTETLGNLGDQESQEVLRQLIEEVLAAKNLPRNQIKIIKTVRALSRLDGFTGNGLLMKLMGREELAGKKVDYLLEKIQAEGFLSKNLDGAAGWSDERCKMLFEFLKINETEWQDEANVAGPFSRGVDIFGWQKMFKYAGRTDVSRHDALFAFDKIIDLYRQSGLSPEKFFGDILNQVYNDSSAYEEGNSYHHFNSIVNSLDLSEKRLAEIKVNAGKFKIKELRDLTENFGSQDKILSSWHSLKNYVGLLWILEQGEILEELAELEEEGQNNKNKEKLAKFIKILAFHRDSKVDKASIVEFWQEPDKFLARMDGHTPENIQNSRKPSNYLEINHLDLAGDELRDALIDGSLDRIQVFPSMEAVYEISLIDEDACQTSGFIETVRRELGSFKENTANKALFNEIRKILKEMGIKIIDFLEKPDENEIFSGLSAVELREIRARIAVAMEKFPNAQIIKNQTAIKKRYRAKVNLKSDPQAILAGNDTACCMPFGSGKNNIYIFNPNCGLFTVEEEKGGDEWKTIAQSVLTLDIDAGVRVPEVVAAVQKSGRLSEILPDQVLKQTENFLACDNIEVAGNAKGKEKIIKEIYRKFFEAYLRYYNAHRRVLPLNQDKLVIGQANSDVRFGLSEDNTFVPAAPVGYSDKLGPKIDALYFKQQEKSGLIVSEQTVNRESGKVADQEASRGISPLTFQDTLAVSLLEDKVYGDNKSLMYHLDLMESILIAKDINNSVKDRPNLSFKFNDKSGRLRGYLLAYEGRGDNGEPMIYVSDLASDRKSKMAGGSLIYSFLDKYKEEYSAEGRQVPVLMEAREGTSYDLIKNNIDKISRKIGRKIKIKELDVYNAGPDRMHRLLITV